MKIRTKIDGAGGGGGEEGCGGEKVRGGGRLRAGGVDGGGGGGGGNSGRTQAFILIAQPALATTGTRHNPTARTGNYRHTP